MILSPLFFLIPLLYQYSQEHVSNVQLDTLRTDSFPLASTSEGPYVEVLEPGMVVLRNFVPESDCKDLVRMATEAGNQGEDGFYTTGPDGEKIFNTGEAGRGRIYDAATRFPKAMTDHCARAVRVARQFDAAMPHMS